MQRPEIVVSFSELRRLATTVPAYLAHFVGVEETVNLQTAIEDDLGLFDLDAQMLLWEFSKKYQVDLAGFDFTGLVSSDGWAPFPGLFQLFLFALRGLLLFPAWLVKLTAGALCWPFDGVWARAIWKINLPEIFLPSQPYQRPRPSQVLTLGDFVASAAAGHFVKRERVRFVVA